MFIINPLLPYTAVTEILSSVYNYYFSFVCRFVLINTLGFVRWYSILAGKIGVSQQESKQWNILQNDTLVNWTAPLILCYKRPKWGGLDGEGGNQNRGKLGDDTLKRWPKENAYDRQRNSSHLPDYGLACHAHTTRNRDLHVPTNVTVPIILKPNSP